MGKQHQDEDECEQDENDYHLSQHTFIMLDKRTLRDGMCCVVRTKAGPNALEWARCEFELASTLLMEVERGRPGLNEGHDKFKVQFTEGHEFVYTTELWEKGEKGSEVADSEHDSNPPQPRSAPKAREQGRGEAHGRGRGRGRGATVGLGPDSASNRISGTRRNSRKTLRA